MSRATLSRKQRATLAEAERGGKLTAYGRGAMDSLLRSTRDPDERRRIRAVLARGVKEGSR